MKNYLYLLVLAPFLIQAADTSQLKPHKEGEYLGAIPSEKPDWFKESFLDLAEDVAEAAEDNKRVMLYFHQPGCPYCAKLVDENFTDDNIKQYVQSNFDVISTNMWGDREIVSIGNKTFTEKEFALALKVQYTPTILFLNEQGKVALRLNGYYPPKKFRSALQYVADHEEKNQNFSQYVQSKDNSNKQISKIIEEDFYVDTLDLSALRTKTNNVIAVFFEQANCSECQTMHEKILADQTTRDIVKRFNNIQIDVNSSDHVITPTGEKLSIKNWIQQLNIDYKPSVVFFDEAGQEVMRIGGFIKTFHFQSVYDYVYEKAYITEPSFQRYIAARGEHIRALGYDTDIWGYHSAYSLKQIQKKN